MEMTQGQRVAEVALRGDRGCLGAVEAGDDRLHQRGPEGVDDQGPCPRCGGSGTLRHGDQRYRTCLDCLGQGLLVTMVGGSLQPTRRISSVASVSRAG